MRGAVEHSSPQCLPGRQAVFSSSPKFYIWGTGKMATKGETVRTDHSLEFCWEPQYVKARSDMVADYLPLVHRLCRRFIHSGEPMEDLVQVGSIGLIRAVDKYDPRRGSSFPAYAIPIIVGEIKNHFRDHGWAVKVPRKLQRQKVAVERAVDTLTHRLGRSPTIPEIAGATGFAEEEVYDTFEVARPLSLDVEYEGSDSEHGSSILDYLGREDPHFEEMIDRIDLDNTLVRLNPRENIIIHLKFYRGLSQTEIADRLGISQMQVSRLQRVALGKLKQSLQGQSQQASGHV